MKLTLAELEALLATRKEVLARVKGRDAAYVRRTIKMVEYNIATLKGQV